MGLASARGPGRHPGQVLLPYAGETGGNAQPGVHGGDRVDKGVGSVRLAVAGEAHQLRQAGQLPVGRRTVIPQDHRQQYRVGKAMAHAVQAAQSVGDGVDVAHTGAGEGEPA